MNDKAQQSTPQHDPRWLWPSLLLVAVGFVTFFSYTTSPLYPGIGDSPDSAMFQIIGRYWSQGDIPYQSLWDLKGPYIFLVNALGYAMTDTRTGVFLIQVVFLTLTLFFTYITLRLALRPRGALLWCIASLLPLSYIYEGGNLTEEYLLPFLSLSFYLILRWLVRFERTAEVSHPSIDAVVEGVTFALCLFSRLTNALSLCAAIVVILVVMVTKRQFAFFLKYLMSFFLGFLLITIPFVSFFSFHGALSDMLKATLVFPFQYAVNATQDIFDAGVHHFVLSYFCAIVLLVIAVTRILRMKTITVRSSLYLAASVCPLLWFCHSNGYAHYGMTVFPLYAIIVMELGQRDFKPVLAIFVAATIIGCGSKVLYMCKMLHWNNPDVAQCGLFLSQAPRVDYSSFVAYNVDPNIYLYLDARPAVPFFCLQDFVVSRIPSLRDSLRNTFINGKVKWILVSYAQRPMQQMVVIDILKQDYKVEKEDVNSKLVLFSKK